jgi:uncharacterized protein YndB with AHSA1/START domain
VSTSDHIETSIEVAVDPHTAFDVFTGEIASWWSFRRGLATGEPGRTRLEIEPGVGGRVLEVHEDRGGWAFEVGRVSVWKPAESLVFTWRQGNFEADQRTEVEVRFEATAEGTRVRVAHRGFDALPLEHSTRHGYGAGPAFVRMYEGFWNDRLAEFGGQTEARSSSRG